MSKKARIVTDSAALVSNPFAALTLEGAPEGPPPAAQNIVDDDDAAPLVASSQRLIVRRQKKGQGGKTVTCVEGLAVETSIAWVRALKQELGCSGRQDGPMLVLGTSDHQRVARWLREAGVAKVVLGN